MDVPLGRSRVEVDVAVGTDSSEPSEAADDFSLFLEPVFERLLRFLKKGIAGRTELRIPLAPSRRYRSHHNAIRTMAA